MFYQSSLKVAVAAVLLLIASSAATGCSSGSPAMRGANGGNGGAGNTSASAGSLSLGGTREPGIVPTSGGGAGVPVDPGGGTTCERASCQPAGGQYCGEIGDNCGGTLVCPSCPPSWSCDQNVCVGGPSCSATTCEVGSSKFCGSIGDGCGKRLDCGTCAAGQTCRSGVCVAPGCVPLTCDTAGGRYCGILGDGCGGQLDCGTCSGGATCGGGGIANVCGGAPDCVPVQCTAANGGKYCGTIGNGCGGVVDCGECAGGAACGADGIRNVCPGTGAACTGLQCEVAPCPDGSTTSVSGTVYDPAGINPIYNAIVYVPNAPLDPVPSGASCDQCGATASGKPITATITDTQGRFRLERVPTGANVPLVIQVGQWRRVITSPNVTSCVDTPITNKDLTRLPRTQAEGHIPRIAVSTGGSDALECLLRRIGIADSEFTTDAGNGRVHLYVGGAPGSDGEGTSSFAPTLNGGVAFPRASTLWSNVEKMKSYDIQLLSCEGSQYEDEKAPYRANMKSYLDGGGRVFASHLHFDWFEDGPAPFQATAGYIGTGEDLPEPSMAFINTTFPKGNAMADWLVFVGATPTRGQLEIWEGQHSVASVNAPTQSWISVPMNPNEMNLPSVQYMTFNTPVEAPAANQCGRVVLTDLHINTRVGDGGGDTSDPSNPFPSGCSARPMTPQAEALEFDFFDLSACVQPDSATPRPPEPPPVVGMPPPAGAAPPPPPPAPPPPPPPPVR
ncbi:MAG TPA: carboxypeptidase-like regulatory domain-containing protein [Polyangiaceae bacterium]|nr:carboxypeptidase-like regulatory domain-containing protein [Polyangiaceae bacterium]